MYRCMAYERYCCYLAGLFPKVVCTSLYLWSGYTLIIGLFFCHIGGYKGAILGLMALILVIIALYTYYRVIHVGPGYPSDFADLKITDLRLLNMYNDGLINNDVVSLDDVPQPPESLVNKSHTIKHNGQFRYCNKCALWKPDRTHHCSVCNRCILRMDHHCPWFATCIGFKNQKFFIQFLVYTSLHALVCLVASISVLWNFFFTDQYLNEYLNLNFIFLFVLSFAISIALTLFTGFAIWLILKNKTTIEFQDSHRYKTLKYSNSPEVKGNIFDVGFRENWTSVMGPNWKFWVLPLAHLDERGGIIYDYNSKVHQEIQSQVELQERLNQQLRTYRAKVNRENDFLHESFDMV